MIDYKIVEFDWYCDHALMGTKIYHNNNNDRHKIIKYYAKDGSNNEIFSVRERKLFGFRLFFYDKK